jgi:hypothetical protein
MSADIHLEHRAGSSQGKHEGESSLGLCDRLNRTRDNSQRQLPTDHDYAVPTREYQTDQSSLKTAPTAARSVFGKRKCKISKQSHRSHPVDTVTPYQANALIDATLRGDGKMGPEIRSSVRLFGPSSMRFRDPGRLSGSNPRKACNEQKSSSVKTNRRRKFSHFLWYSFATDGPRRARLGNDER